MNRTSRSRRRFQLSPETIRILSSRALRRVEGGRLAGSAPTVIEPTCDDCPHTQPVTITNELCELG
jgi:hypothetical protein